jgi:hypothetical protein
MRTIELGAAVLAALVGLSGLGRLARPDAAASELGPAVVALYLIGIGLVALYLIGIGLGAYLHAARGDTFGLGLLWACALGVLGIAVLGAFSIGASLIPAALVAVLAATAGTLDADPGAAAGERSPARSDA